MSSNKLRFFLNKHSASNLLTDNSLPEAANSQIRRPGSSLNKPSTLLTQAIINMSSQPSKSLRHSNPTISISSAYKFEPSLSVVDEKSAGDADGSFPHSGLNSSLLEDKTSSTENTSPSLPAIQATKSIAPTEGESPICTISQVEEDTKSVKSEVFFDAEESLPLEIPEQEQESKLIRRRKGRDESNFSLSFLGKTLNSDNTDESDSVSKKRNASRNVSFSQGSRRWSRLRSVTKSTSRFSTIIRKASLKHTSEDIGVEVELRKRR